MKKIFAGAAALLIFVSCGQQSPAPAAAATSSAGSEAGKASVPSSQSALARADFTSSSGVEMVFLPGGQFTMGTDKGNPDEAPAHAVTLTAFAIDKFEVNGEMFTKAQVPNPSHWSDNPKRPVERVRWRDAKAYCNERSALEGLKPCYNEKTADWDCDYSANGYRLPTEAEWEFACKAGTDGAYDFGAAANLRQYSWCAENSEEKTHPVAQKKPNRWGIYDLYGNVSEWCEDVYSPTYYKNSPPKDPTGPPSPGKDVQRVMRGGSWKSTPDMCRATFRQGQKTGDTDACFYTDYCGFRCVRRITPEELSKLKGK